MRNGQVDIIETVQFNALGFILPCHRLEIAHVELNRAGGGNLGKVRSLDLADVPCAGHLVARARQHHVIVAIERKAQRSGRLREDIYRKAAVGGNVQRRRLPRLHKRRRRALGKPARYLGRLAHPLKRIGGF